ncbi:hypothetical protein AAA512_11235, partial [Pseudomonas aeruginosa]|uniref:hypothetical protein n=1 Tax=Pseudomonas aeruginosa TaxID=287 RepID=UPI001F1ED91E
MITSRWRRPPALADRIRRHAAPAVLPGSRPSRITFVRLCLSAVDEEDDSGITARGPTEQEIRQTRRKRKTQGTTETKKAAIGRFLRGSPRLGVVKMYGAADGT